MSRTISLYHGSPVIVEKPQFGKGKRTNDYGQGFYCTEDPELAKEWACPGHANGFCNFYRMDLESLQVIRLNGQGFSILHWLALLLENRKVSLQTPLELAAANYILQHFHKDFSAADVLIGYRADDRYFSFVRAFLSNQITVSQLSLAMRLGKLGEQVFLKSQKAFDSIIFRSAEPVDWNIYFHRREKRAEQAASDYQKILKQTGLSGIYMADVLRGQITLEQLEQEAAGISTSRS